MPHLPARNPDSPTSINLRPKSEPGTSTITNYFNDLEKDGIKQSSDSVFSIGNLISSSNVGHSSAVQPIRNILPQGNLENSSDVDNSNHENKVSLLNRDPINISSPHKEYVIKCSTSIPSPVPKYPPGISAFSPAGRLLSLLPEQHPYHVILRREWEHSIKSSVAPHDIFTSNVPANERQNYCSTPENIFGHLKNNNVGDSDSPRSGFSRSRSRSVSPRIVVDSSPLRAASPIEKKSYSERNLDDILSEDEEISLNKSIKQCGTMPKRIIPCGNSHNTNTLVNYDQDSSLSIIQQKYAPKTEYISNNMFMSSSNNVVLSSNKSEHAFAESDNQNTGSERSFSPFDLSSFPRFYFNSKVPVDSNKGLGVSNMDDGFETLPSERRLNRTAGIFLE